LSICRLGAWSGSGVRRGRREATEPRHDWGIADITESGGRWPGVGRRKWRDHRNPPDLSRRGHGRRAGGKEAAKCGGGEERRGGAKAGSPARKHRAVRMMGRWAGVPGRWLGLCAYLLGVAHVSLMIGLVLIGESEEEGVSNIMVTEQYYSSSSS
jgi:hypothetical protein